MIPKITPNHTFGTKMGPLLEHLGGKAQRLVSTKAASTPNGLLDALECQFEHVRGTLYLINDAVRTAVSPQLLLSFPSTSPQLLSSFSSSYPKLLLSFPSASPQ